MISQKMEAFYQGESCDAYTFMGAHPLPDGIGFSFRVWAPKAKSVHLVGDFNFWNKEEISMEKDAHGSWYAESRFAREGQKYQYYIEGEKGNFIFKSDPYARAFAPLPQTASVITQDRFVWSDGDYLKKKKNPLGRPLSIYEVHAGSWKRHPNGAFYTYRDLAETLVPYVKEMGYTHVEFLPLTEYPFEGSWGYQVTGYFAPTHRYGSPEDLKFLIDAFHKEGIGVILDWVPAHFPKDESGLYEFDGSFCYEKSDPKMQEHAGWGTRIFDYSRFEVQSFLMSSALFWLKEYHVDGLRVDAVASMLYLDYCRKDFTPNREGGNYDLDVISFFRKLNVAAFRHDPSCLMVAEESTAFPLITKPPEVGGLGFNLKWNMGWMNDILAYMKTDPLFRKGRHNDLTFSSMYAFAENYVLPLSHDEVVHLKKAIIEKMPGSYEDKFQQAKLLYAFMFAHPGGKLNFMGNEFGQFTEWCEKRELDWTCLRFPLHQGLSAYFKELNLFYRKCRPLWENDTSDLSFRWISADDRDNSIIAFRRIGKKGEEVLCIFNFCPVKRDFYRIGLPEMGTYKPIFTSDLSFGMGKGKPKKVAAETIPFHNLPCSGEFSIPPYSALFYRKIKSRKKEELE